MRFDIITIFPKIFDSYFSESILKRAQEKKLIAIQAHDLRQFAAGRHNKVDDTPYGGGPGMVMQVEPIAKAVQKLKTKNLRLTTRIILFSTRGKKFDAKTAKRLSKYNHLILICGRYEGVDERVAEHIVDEEISIGDFVLAGGEIPAMVVVEAVSRFIPGVLGKYESLEDIKGSYPVYTKPEVFTPQLKTKNSQLATEKSRKSSVVSRKLMGWRVPKVLLSGDHQKIAEWRKRSNESS
jgi:tRNA (guanine37-N1)-methyltransferase